MIQCYLIFLFYTWTIFTNVIGVLRIPTESKVHTDLIDIHLIEGRRTKRSIDDSFHPESYDIDLPFPESKIQLHLIRNDNIGTTVPTLCLQQGALTNRDIKDEFESAFYQDIKQGATFVVQRSGFQASNMFGTFNLDGEEFIIQNIRNQSLTHIKHGSNKFEISRHRIPEVHFGDILDSSKKIQNEAAKHKTRRHKRATGEHKLELLIVTDYAVYKYWYDKSTKTTTTEKETDALTSVRQFYAFIITGMDGMYKNIQTTSYTISVVFAGIIIAQTPSDATWTENVKVTTVSPNQVDSNLGLSAFRTWVRAASNLPGHDHAMLFTRYDLTSGGSTGNAGLAYVAEVCTDSSQSIVEDGFDFIMITVASHELGHCLSAQHDGEGNSCNFNDQYIMAASTGPQRNAATATHPWIFSSCSTTYFTNYINSLDSSSNNCLKSLSPGFNPNGLSPYDQNLAGQVYSADNQCAHMRGTGSYFCNDRYNGDFSTICTVMWCSDVTGNGYCHTHIAGDGTLCGNNKWCRSGVCTSDANAPSGNENCLYGDKKGAIYSDGRTCADLVAENAVFYCQYVSTSCCYSCGPPTTTSTTSTASATTRTTTILATTSPVTQSVGTSVTTSTAPLTTTQINSLHPDNQCESKRGTGSHMCRFFYNGDYTSICTTLYCSSPTSSTCYFETAAEGTMCGNKKWCVSGVCTNDINAPSGDDSCLYGDRIGAIFNNGWDCATMVRIAPNNCASVTTQCCAACAPSTTTSTTQKLTTALTTTNNPSTEMQTTTDEILFSTVEGSTTQDVTTIDEALTTTSNYQSTTTSRTQTTDTLIKITSANNPTTTETLTTTSENPTTTPDAITTTSENPTTTLDAITTTTENPTTTPNAITTTSENPTTTPDAITTTSENPTSTHEAFTTSYKPTTISEDITTTTDNPTTTTAVISTTTLNSAIRSTSDNPNTTPEDKTTSSANPTATSKATTTYDKTTTTPEVQTTTFDNPATKPEAISTIDVNPITTENNPTTTKPSTTMADNPTTVVIATAEAFTTTVDKPATTTSLFKNTPTTARNDQTTTPVSSTTGYQVSENTTTAEGTTAGSQTISIHDQITSTEFPTTAVQYQSTVIQGMRTTTKPFVTSSPGQSTASGNSSTTSQTAMTTIRNQGTTTQTATSTVHNPSTTTQAATSTVHNPSTTTRAATSIVNHPSTTTQAETSTVHHPSTTSQAAVTTISNPSTSTDTTTQDLSRTIHYISSTPNSITTKDHLTTTLAITTTQQEPSTSVISSYDPTTIENIPTTTTTPTTTYKPAPRECKLRCRLRLRFTVTFDLSNQNTNNYRTLFSQTVIALTNYYRRSRSCGSRFRRIILYSIRVGSLIADHDVVADEESEGNIVSAVNDLVTGYGNLTFGNDSYAQTVEALNASITDNNVTSSVNPGDDLCKIFNQIESCANGYGCTIDTTDNSPYCAPLESEDTYELLFGLAVGIPAFFLLLGFTLIISVYCRRRKQRKPLVENRQNERPVPPEQQIFATNWPHRYSSLGRKSTDPLGGYWDNGAFESQESYDNGLYQRSIFAFPSGGSQSLGKMVRNGKTSHI